MEMLYMLLVALVLGAAAYYFFVSSKREHLGATAARLAAQPTSGAASEG